MTVGTKETPTQTEGDVAILGVGCQQRASMRGGTQQYKQQQQQQEVGGSAEQDPFECNICLETAKEPVVTLCGHLFCWPCLYKWMRTQQLVRTCPCCKAGIDIDKVVPIYARGTEEDPRKGLMEYLPPRPQGQRTMAVQQRGFYPDQNNLQNTGGWAAILSSMGIGGNNSAMSDFTPEQQHQAFLSRLLLMLGSFVIMCLLLF